MDNSIHLIDNDKNMLLAFDNGNEISIRVVNNKHQFNQIKLSKIQALKLAKFIVDAEENY
jgi:hypothetical protein